MRLLLEADRWDPDAQLARGEYRIDGSHLFVACFDCGRVSQIMRKAFEGRFACRCGFEEDVKLTGDRA